MRTYAGLASWTAISAAIASPVLAESRSVGDKVQYFDAGWWDATIIEIGSGEHAGYYKVKADKYSTVQWSAAKNVRARPGAPPAAPAAGPRAGDYSILSYGAPTNPPIRLGKITLAGGGSYRFFDNGDKLLGDGRYSFADGRVVWLTGLLKTQGWGGELQVTRNGQTHTIRLKRGTIATNSG